MRPEGASGDASRDRFPSASPDGRPNGGPPPGAGRHLVDATMFWNPSGGVRRYVMAKHAWLAAEGGWRHTVATPTPDADASSGARVDRPTAATPDVPSSESPDGRTDALSERPSMRRIAAWPLPGSGGAYRLPVRRAAAAADLRELVPDLIESADPYRLAWSTLDAARALGVPAVAFCHSNLPCMARLAAGSLFPGLAERAARAYLVRLYDRFDRVLAPSRSMTALLQDWGLAHARHQPLGVDTALFRPRPRQPGWRHRLGIPDDARLLVFAGRFAPEKGLPTLAEAVRQLGRGHWLLAVGAGPSPPVGARVVVLPTIGQPDRLAGVLREADCFVHAGAQETFGLSVLEAMACGLPVVARSAAGTGELVDASVGHAVDADDAARFAEGIESVFARDAAALGEAARRRAVDHDWRNVLPGLERTYRELIDDGPGRRSAA